MDFDALESLPELKEGKVGAICCSRPTNPTGNVLTDGEMARLDALAQEHGIPLIIDNAYGMPFSNIIYSDVTLNWHENIILCFSLSKICLPGVRTGIIIAAVAGRSSETAFRRRHPAVLPQSGANRRLAAQARAGRVSAENP